MNILPGTYTSIFKEELLIYLNITNLQRQSSLTLGGSNWTRIFVNWKIEVEHAICHAMQELTITNFT